MIRLDGVTVRAGDFLLEDISFTVPEGGYAMILGPTGSGKTTLLEAIAGNGRLVRGRVELHDEDVTDRAPEQRGLGFVYQHYHLFPHLSVRDNIAYGLRRRLPQGAREERVRELADMLGITTLLDRAPAGLSGGEQQRTALARALAPRPRILLLDEPFAAVDPATRRGLRGDLRELHEREGITTLQVTHDFEDALRMGDHVAILSEGRIVQQGRPEEVFRYPGSAFVARFTGAGNVLAGEVTPEGPSDGDGRFAGRFRSGPLAFDVVTDRSGPVHAILRPEDIVVSRRAHEGSARNRIQGRVVRLERAGPVTQVFVDVGRPLVASITTASAEEMALAPGDDIALTFKAMAVHLV